MISQMDLVNGIMGLITKADEKLVANPRQINAIIDAADKILEEFKKPDTQAAPNIGLTAWLKTDDTGQSALWIARVLYSSERPDLNIPDHGNHHPQDPSDFGRCYRFLRAVPGSRDRMPLVAGTSEQWDALWSHWDELEKLYEQESPTGSCPVLFDRMKQLFKTKAELRAEYIKKHGRCCETCDNNPVNRGQRATCRYDTGPGMVGYKEGDPICKEDNGYPEYVVAKSIYSIDIPYCC